MNDAETKRKWREKQRKWRETHPGYNAASQRKWRETHPGYNAAVKRKGYAKDPCRAAALQRKWQAKHPGYNAELQRKWRAKNFDYLRKLRKANPEKAKAWDRVKYLMSRGKLMRLPCEVCGNPKTDGHHADYSKPDEVRWLCALHHRREHQKERQQ